MDDGNVLRCQPARRGCTGGAAQPLVLVWPRPSEGEGDASTRRAGQSEEGAHPPAGGDRQAVRFGETEPHLRRDRGRTAPPSPSCLRARAERKQYTAAARRVAEPVVVGPARPRFRPGVTPELRVGKPRFDRTKTGRRRAAVTWTKSYLVPRVGILQPLGPAATRTVFLFTRGKKARTASPVRRDGREGR